MPRPFPTTRPPCPNPKCRALLRKHDKVAGRQRYRCPVCRELITPGKSADWVTLASQVMTGATTQRMAQALKADEQSVRSMLFAWATRAQEMNSRQPPMDGSRRVDCAVGGYFVSVGIARGKMFRIIEWMPYAAGPLSDSGVSKERDWVATLIGGGKGDQQEVEARLWVALARSNGWRP